MSEEEQLRSETLVEIHRANTEWEGNMLVSLLSDNGVEAAQRYSIAAPPIDPLDVVSGAENDCGIFVLEHDADRAAALVKEFLSAATDDSALEQASTESPPPANETA